MTPEEIRRIKSIADGMRFSHKDDDLLDIPEFASRMKPKDWWELGVSDLAYKILNVLDRTDE